MNERRTGGVLPHRAAVRPGRADRAAGLLCGLAAFFLAPVLATGATAFPETGTALFGVTNLWTVHLRFTAAEWKAMEPAGGPGGFGFGGAPGRRGPGRPDRDPAPPDRPRSEEAPGPSRAFGGPGGPGGPAGLGGPPGMNGPGGPEGLGPGMFLAPAFLGLADADRDGRLTRAEWLGMGDTWFERWDTNRTASLTAEQVRNGLNAMLASPPANAAPGPGPADRRPDRGPGGFPGMNLRGREGQRNGLASMLGIDFPTVQAELEFEGRRFAPVSVRYKGNGTFMESRGSLKRSLKIDLDDQLSRQHLAGVTKLNLHNGVTDASWMNEVLSHRLFRDAGVPAPRTAYARVFLTVPGEHHRTFLGLYSLVENPDRNFAEAAFGTRKGALFKPVTPRLFEDLGDAWPAYRQTYDPKTPLSDAETRRVIEFCKLVSHADDATFAARAGEFLDLEAFARFMAVTVWLSTLDSILGPGQNYLVHLHPVTRKFSFIPWDLDHSFGQFPMLGSQEERENLSLQRPWQGEPRFLERVYALPAFQDLYRARLAEFNRTICRPERLQAQVDEIAAAIRDAVAEESAEKLARFDLAVAGENPGPARRDPGGRGFGPPGGRGGFGDFQPPKPIRTFVPARWKSVDDQLAGRSEGQTVDGLGFGGGPRGGPGGGGPGPGDRGPNGPPGSPGGFGPGLFLAPVLVGALDADKNGSLERAEVAAGLGKWFTDWDADRAGVLTEDQLRAGLNRTFTSPAPGFPGAGPGGPGGFGGPGGPGGPPGPAPGTRNP